jgi:hypothetical protein
MNAKARNWMLGLLGAVAGGALGYFGFVLALRSGLYALMLPGGLIGLGGGWLVKDRSVLRASLFGVFALCLALFAEWKNFPFNADSSFSYFVTHLQQLRGLTLLMLAGGTALAVWLSLGKPRSAGPPLNN